jgi:hypothetical protein
VPTATPTPCDTPARGTKVTGNGSIATNSGQATFTFDVQPRRARRNTASGFFNYADPGAGIQITAGQTTSLMITGNHARFSGTMKISRRVSLSFTVDVDDFVNCPDGFTIRMSNGYVAFGELISGDLSIHN